MMDKINIDDKFGRWIVNYSVKKDNRNYWNCTCECGTNRNVRQEDLLNGKSKSCGCLNREISSQKGKEKFSPNKIIEHEDYIEIILSNYSKETCLIDKEDYSKIKDYKWRYNENRRSVQANNRDSKNKSSVKIHRLITNCPKNLKVDHINHNVLDNRKSNLRICTNMENQWNKGKTCANTSGHKGIYDDKSRPRFQVYITVNGKRRTKSFPYNKNNKEQIYKMACEWQEKTDKELCKEFSYYNSVLKEKEN